MSISNNFPGKKIKILNKDFKSALPVATYFKPYIYTDASSNFCMIKEGMDVLELPETGQGLRSWIRIDASGNTQVIDVDKLTIIRRCGISARDLRILDPLFVYPTTVLGREKAIVVNFETIRCIITADEVLLLNSLDENVLRYVMELEKRLTTTTAGLAEFNPKISNPFEFRALAVALKVVSSSLDHQASDLEIEAYPLLDELTSQISTLNLERVRRLKSKLVALTRRIHKIRDEIEKIMDDSENMAAMYLTEKKTRKMEFRSSNDGEGRRFESSDPIIFSRFSSSSVPSNSCRLTKNLSCSWDNTIAATTAKSVEELESLLEAYFVVIDSILNKLITLKEYIDDTENFINIQMNNVRNRLIQFELLLTTATFILAIFGIVIGIFGINFPVPLFNRARKIKLVLIITGACGIFIYSAFVCFFKWKKLLLL